MWPSIIIFFLLLLTFSDETELKIITSYVCPEQEAVFRCIVHDGVTTTWRGSALENCSDGSVTLRHSQFGNGTTINKTCGATGQVIGQAISTENGSFVSQLTIFAYQELDGSIIECDTSRIQVLLITAYLHSSSQIVVSDVNPRHLTLQWSPPAVSANSYPLAFVSYYIMSSTDGSNCTNNTTNGNEIICSLPFILQPTFILNVQPVVCGNIFGAVSTLLVHLIRVLSTPTVKSTKIFNSQTVIQTTFHKTKSFNISEGIDGSASSYTITYTDVESGGISVCDSIEVPALRCQEGLCRHLFDASSSPCVNSTNISVAVYATNILGNGPASEPVSIELYHRGGESSSCEYLKSDLDTSLFIGIGAAMIILLITSLSIIIIVALIRNKAKLQKELETLTAGNTKVIYEEVNNHPSPSLALNTRENSAYGVCI